MKSFRCYPVLIVAMSCSWTTSTSAGTKAATVLAQACPEGQWCQWTIGDGGNGHWYRWTDVVGTWTQAEAEAIARGGHLVSINTPEENAWLCEKFPNSVHQSFSFWHGLYQDLDDPTCAPNCENDGGWKWVSGEPVTYLNWGLPHEPNNSGGGENFGCLRNTTDWGPDDECEWNDYREPPHALGFSPMPGVIESQFGPSIPAVSSWGLAVLTMAILATGTLVVRRTAKPERARLAKRLVLVAFESRRALTRPLSSTHGEEKEVQGKAQAKAR